MDNRLREALAGGRFAITVEVVAPAGDGLLDEGLTAASAMARAVAADDRVAGLRVTDRVRADDDHDPVRVAAILGAISGKMPIVNLAGKGRRAEQIAWSLGALAEGGIDNVLCITGDRLKATSAGPRDRYLDSVDAVRLVRRLMPSALVAAGVSPFKYTEEETFNQYFKMARKRRGGRLPDHANRLGHAQARRAPTLPAAAGLVRAGHGQLHGPVTRHGAADEQGGGARDRGDG